MAAVVRQAADAFNMVKAFVEQGVEMTYGDPPDIMRVPAVENFAQKAAPLISTNGKRQQIAILVEFHAGYVLMKVKSMVNQVAVDASCMVDIRFADECQNVKFDSVTA